MAGAPSAGGSGPVRPVALTTSSQPAPPKGSRLVRWIRQYAPAGGGGSEYEEAYRSFVAGDCADTLEVARRLPGTSDPGNPSRDGLAEPHRSLYEGAAAACLAALHRRADLWPVADARRDTVTGEGLSCWEREVLTVLRGLVDAHRADPELSFSRAAATGALTCPVLDGLAPDHGSRAGGYVVEVTGRALPRAPMELILTAGDRPTVRTTVDGAGRHTFVMPPVTPDGAAQTGVRIADAPRVDDVEAMFRFDP